MCKCTLEAGVFYAIANMSEIIPTMHENLPVTCVQWQPSYKINLLNIIYLVTHSIKTKFLTLRSLTLCVSALWLLYFSMVESETHLKVILVKKCGVSVSI